MNSIRIFILIFFALAMHIQSMAQQMPLTPPPPPIQQAPFPPADFQTQPFDPFAMPAPGLNEPIPGALADPLAQVPISGQFTFQEPQQFPQAPLPPFDLGQIQGQIPQVAPFPPQQPAPAAAPFPFDQPFPGQTPAPLQQPFPQEPLQFPQTPTAQPFAPQAPAPQQVQPQPTFPPQVFQAPAPQQFVPQAPAQQLFAPQAPAQQSFAPQAAPQAIDPFAGQLAAQPFPQGTLAPTPPTTPQYQVMPAAQAPAVDAMQRDLEQTTKQEVKDDGAKDIYLNFENTELASFINYMAEIKNLNIIPDPALEGAKISLTIREPLSIDGAWNIFLTVLEMAGFSIVKLGEVYKILPKDKKLNQPLPAYINVPVETLPDSDETIRYVFFLSNIQVADIQGLLESMLSTPNVVIAQREINGFIITDKSYNIKAAVKLIQELDQMGLPENVTVIKLKNANATDVRDLLQSLIKQPEGNPLARLLGKTAEGKTEYFSSTTRVVPEERTNSLILLGDKNSTQRIVDFITKHIDTELKGADSPLYIYELQYADATQVREILQEVTTPPDSTAGQQASKYGAIRGGVKYFRGMNFKVDKDGNRLIIACPDKQDWRLLKKTIQDLDKPQPQVAIETLIVVVNVNDTKKLGGAIRNKKHGNLGRNIDFQAATSVITEPALQPEKNGTTPENPENPISLLGNMFSKLATEQGQSILAFGKDSNIWAVFRALKSLQNTSILSQPFVTIANKTEAKIVVGETKRVVKEESGGTQGFDDAQANTEIKLTPQINPDGIIRLDIDVTVDTFITDDGTQTTNKNLKTNVTVADGQVLVLGGFVRTKVDEQKSKTPILGDIPLLGWFFKNQQRVLTKEYTFIFMSPTIVKPRKTPGIQLYTKLKLHEATDEIEDIIETKKVMDPIHNWFFNPDKENYSHKVIDFANARYQPTTVDIKNDPYYRSQTQREEDLEEIKARAEEKEARERMAQEQQVSTLEADPVEGGIQPEAQMTYAEQPQEPYVTQEQTQLFEQQPPIKTYAESPVRQEPSDQELEQRRAQFKTLMMQQAPAQPEPINPEKRQSFKDLISSQATTQPTADEQAILSEKRNKLKEFLAANPTLASNSAKRLKTRKASA